MTIEDIASRYMLAVPYVRFLLRTMKLLQQRPGRGRPRPTDRNVRMANEFRTGMSIEDIAKRHVLAVPYVRLLLKSINMPGLTFVDGRRSKKARRNMQILNEYQSGKGVAELSRKYGLTNQRIHQIASVYARKNGVRLRPKQVCRRHADGSYHPRLIPA